MAYTKQTWANTSGGGTPISAARLNYIEDGLEDAADDADQGVSDAATAAAAAVTAQDAADAAQVDADAAQSTANAAIPATTATTKGDLLVRNASVVTRQPVGTDGRFLEADTSTATGIKWGRKFTVAGTAPASPTAGDIWLRPVT
jgi:hypothetical protein